MKNSDKIPSRFIKKSFPKKTKETSEIKKDFYNRLFFILLATFPLIILANENGFLRFIAGAAFLLILYQLIMILSLSPRLIDEFFPPKKISENETKVIDKYIYYCASFSWFIALIFLIFEIKTIDNTIDGTKLFWISAGVGILFFTLIITILKLFYTSVFDIGQRRYMIYAGFFIACFLFFPSASSFINHYFSEKKTQEKIYKISDKGSGGTRYKEYHIFLKINKNNAEERFIIPKKLYDKLKINDEVILITKHGKFGYEIVTGIKSKNQW